MDQWLGISNEELYSDSKIKYTLKEVKELGISYILI